MSRGRAATYTAEEDAVLIEHYAKSGAPYCARRLNRTLKQIWGRAHILGLTRTGRRRVNGVVTSGRSFDHRALSDALGAWRPNR